MSKKPEKDKLMTKIHLNLQKYTHYHNGEFCFTPKMLPQFIENLAEEYLSDKIENISVDSLYHLIFANTQSTRSIETAQEIKAFLSKYLLNQATLELDNKGE